MAIIGGRGELSTTQIYGSLCNASNTDQAYTDCYIPVEGVAKNLYGKASVAPGVGKSFTITLQKNRVDTALACTIADAATTCSDEEDVNYVTGDIYSYRFSSSGSPANSKNFAGTYFEVAGGGGGTSPFNATSLGVSLGLLLAVLVLSAWITYKFIHD